MPKRIFSPRQILVYVGVAALLLLAEPEPMTYAIGCTIALCGVVLRAWACGHLRKNQEVTTSGPYAHVKHPMYLGTMLVAVGGIVAAGSAQNPGLLVWIVVAPLFALLFFGFYLPKKRHVEAGRLQGKFAADFNAWAAAVPDFVPTLRRFRETSGRRWSWHTYRSNHELEMGALIAVLFVALQLT